MSKISKEGYEQIQVIKNALDSMYDKLDKSVFVPKGKKSKNALKKLRRLDMDEESSGDEEDDNDLTLTRIPTIDMSDPLKFQYERMRQRERLGGTKGYLYEKEKKKYYYPTD